MVTFQVQKHLSFSSDITQKKAQFVDHWFVMDRTDMFSWSGETNMPVTPPRHQQREETT